MRLFNWLRGLEHKKTPPPSEPLGSPSSEPLGSPSSEPLDSPPSASLGPNMTKIDATLTPGSNPSPGPEPRFEFTIDPLVAQRFNAYASAAIPNEIGGLLRVVRESEGQFRAIDLRIFEHTSASGTYFELNGSCVAKFNMELVRKGRGEEIAEWCSLIHSHPGFAPFLSGVDRENIVRLAGPGFAFSVICSAHRDGQGNRYALHYAQDGAMPLVITNLDCLHCESFDGVDLLSEDKQEEIKEHAYSCLLGSSTLWSNNERYLLH